MTAAWVYTLISAAVVTLGYRCGQCSPPPRPYACQCYPGQCGWCQLPACALPRRGDEMNQFLDKRKPDAT